MRRTTAAALVLTAPLIGLAAARTQTQGTGSQDIMPALLAEVRGLRQAMERSATSGAKVQLVLGRLQLQEQRVTSALRRLDEIRSKLNVAQREAAGLQDRIEGVEAELKDAAVVPRTPAPGERPRPSREQLEMMLTDARRELERKTSEVQRLGAEEAQVASEVTNEQARWFEFNQRLEELERALGR
jgi:DNA repair exonuclease SbcCD ATPase subunit